jgi:hypothetical protein
METLLPKEPQRGWQCMPANNQLLAFDGSLLHCVMPAPPQFRRCIAADGSTQLEREADRSQRVTMIVNFWCHELDDASCVDLPIKDVTTRRYGAPIDVAPHESTSSSLASSSSSSTSSSSLLTSPVATLSSSNSLSLLGPEVRSMYFFDHDGSKAAAFEKQEGGDAEMGD